jgi:gamma-glutamyltranspeptidase / glutathione hydrolase
VSSIRLEEWERDFVEKIVGPSAWLRRAAKRDLHLFKERSLPVRLILCGLFVLVICGEAMLGSTADEKDQPPKALAEGQKGMIVGTTGPQAVKAGLETLKQGGSAADAAMATSLAQVVECGGSYVSHAGILTMVYYEAATGKVHYLNACYNTPREEKDPLSIPSKGKPSGRTALVPGYMAGVQAAHDRFGKLPRKAVFAPAVEMADQGMKVSPLLARFLQGRKSVLSRLPETKGIFTKPDGSFYREGEHFKQPALAKTLRRVADDGAAFMYTGEWAEQFVAAVQKEGGKITMEDMKAYRVIWEEPLRTTYRGHEVCVPGFSSQGGVTMIEALHLLERADLPRTGHFASSPKSLFWLLQISHLQILGFLSESTLKGFPGVDLTPQSRVKRETAAILWQQMQDGKWPFAAKLKEGTTPPNHSDGVVAVDQWGNVAVVTHSINTTLWGDTAIFVGGISIPDSATFQQDMIHRTGPGKRLPDPTCPLLVLKDGKPVLGSSAIGGGLHQRTLQVLSSFLDFNMDPQAAVEQPAFMLPAFSMGMPTAQVEKDHFDKKVVEALRGLGQPVKELSPTESGAFRGYWIGVHIPVGSNLRRGVGTRKAPLPSVAEGY